MKKKLLFFFMIPLVALAQKVEFGLQFQQNQNQISSVANAGDFDEVNHFFDILGESGDTIGVYMRSYDWSNNFEIPVYLRYSLKNRFFFEFTYSNSINSIRINGHTNYNGSFFTNTYGTWAEFDSTATAQGITVDSSDYVKAMTAYRQGYIRDIEASEEFKMSSFGFNFGMKFLPHKSIRPYLTAGITYKNKFRKHRFQNLEYSNPDVKNYSAVEQGIDRVRTDMFFLNFSGGLEFYRFRIEGFYQGVVGSYLQFGKPNNYVMNVKPGLERRNFHRHSVVGFKLSATLFSKYLGRDVHHEELSDESIAISNIRKKKLNWSLGFRFKRRVLQSLSSFYENGEPLNVLKRDSAYLSNGVNFYLTERLQYISLGEITRANWGGQIEIFGDYHFSKRFFITGTTSFSNLTFDVKSQEFQGVVAYDSLGNASWVQTAETPIVKTGVYRKQMGVLGGSTQLNYELIQKEDFSVRLNAGFGSKLLIPAFYAKNLPAGVNDLQIYEDFDQKYGSLSFKEEEVELYAETGNLEITPSVNPGDVIAQFPTAKMDSEWKSPKPQRFNFNYITVGTEVTVDRFTIGFSYETNLKYMDGFMLSDYQSLFFNIGYRLISR